jgi:hypothetical protein
MSRFPEGNSICWPYEVIDLDLRGWKRLEQLVERVEIATEKPFIVWPVDFEHRGANVTACLRTNIADEVLECLFKGTIRCTKDSPVKPFQIAFIKVESIHLPDKAFSLLVDLAGDESKWSYGAKIGKVANNLVVQFQGVFGPFPGELLSGGAEESIFSDAQSYLGWKVHETERRDRVANFVAFNG